MFVIYDLPRDPSEPDDVRVKDLPFRSSRHHFEKGGGKTKRNFSVKSKRSQKCTCVPFSTLGGAQNANKNVKLMVKDLPIKCH